MTVLLVIVGGAVGAPVRYLLDRAVQSRAVQSRAATFRGVPFRAASVFPWGTLTVNVLGSLLLGVLVGLPAAAEVSTLLGVGFCGALTTCSTFGYETLTMLRTRKPLLAALYVAGSLVAGLGAVCVGVTVGSTL